MHEVFALSEVKNVTVPVRNLTLHEFRSDKGRIRYHIMLNFKRLAKFH